MARLSLLIASLLTSAAAIGFVSAQEPAAPGQLKNRKQEELRKAQQQEQEPPEEDPGLKEKVYSFNPLQAAKELKAGEFYFKKGNYKAAARRFREATRWDPTSAEAVHRLAQAEEKMKDAKAAREAYAKYLELAPDAKDAESIRKKIAAHP